MYIISINFLQWNEARGIKVFYVVSNFTAHLRQQICTWFFWNPLTGSHIDLKQKPEHMTALWRLTTLCFQEKCFCTFSSNLLLWIDIYGSIFLSLTGEKLKGPPKLDTEVHLSFKIYLNLDRNPGRGFGFAFTTCLLSHNKLDNTGR